MAKVKVKLADNIARVVFIEKDATIGATIGVDLKDANGNVLTREGLAAYLGVGTTQSGNPSHHRLLQGLQLGDDHPQYTRKDTLTAAGDIYVRDANTVVRLPLGSPTQILRVSGASPQWYDADANPSVTVGLTAKNGTADTFLRSDAAPALDQSISPTWTGEHTFSDVLAINGELWLDGSEGSAGQFLRSSGAGVTPVWADVPSPARGATFVSPSGPIVTPVNDVYVRITKSGTINKVTLLTEGGPGACVVDIWKDTYANFPPTNADTICGASKPTISGGIKYEDSTLSGWTTSVTAGDVLVFHLQSVSTFSLIFVQLDIS